MLSSARLAELTTLAAGVVEEIRAGLPAEVRAAAEECASIFLTMDDWSREENEEPDAELLGLFMGLGRDEGSPGGPDEMPRIYLFVDNLWEWSEEDRAVFAEEVETTFLHELGHYLGWDEDEVAERGLA